MSPRVIVFAVTPGVLAPAAVDITNDAMTSEPANTATVIAFVRTMDPPFLLPQREITAMSALSSAFHCCPD
jgi:hypothetical protein